MDLKLGLIFVIHRILKGAFLGQYNCIVSIGLFKVK